MHRFDKDKVDIIIVIGPDDPKFPALENFAREQLKQKIEEARASGLTCKRNTI